MGKTIICTSFYHTDGDSHNLGPNKDKNKVYYQCITVFFESVRRFHDFDLILFTNKEIPDEHGLLAKIGIKQIIVPDTKYVDCDSVTNRFPGCLFKLDVINYLCGMDFSSVCFFDNDCVFQSEISDMIDWINQGYLTAIEIYKDIYYDLNGQTIKTLANFIGVETNCFTFVGGEFIGFNKETCLWMNEKLIVLWERLLNSSLTHNFVDEHVLSLIFSLCDRASIDNLFLKRHWTSPLYNNTDGTEGRYKVLHLPAEKNGFFRKQYEFLCETMTKHI